MAQWFIADGKKQVGQWTPLHAAILILAAPFPLDPVSVSRERAHTELIMQGEETWP